MPRPDNDAAVEAEAGSDSSLADEHPLAEVAHSPCFTEEELRDWGLLPVPEAARRPPELPSDQLRLFD